MDFAHAPILLLIGCAILAGSVGARLFQKLRIPQVVGYIAIGVLVGKSGFGLIGDESIERLMPLNFLALGIIGFMIGGELHRNVFKVHGRQFLRILLGESLGAFVVVTATVTLLVLAFTGDAAVSAAFGLMLGAISSATAPAATVDVLWEYRTRGILTTTVLAIVALDDALALALYSVAASITMVLLGGAGESLGHSLLGTLYELGGAVVLGGAAGATLSFLVKRTQDSGRILTSIAGVLTLVIGLALAVKVDVILAAMALGMTLVNLAPHRSRDTFGLIEKFSPPIYALFFVFVGARLSIGGLHGWMWAAAAGYVIARTVGKMIGANLGARWGGASDAVRRYLGLCLFSQAGVAIGLSILAGMRFSDQSVGGVVLGDAIILIITTTTFLVQIIGPPCVKLAVTKAGEVGLNITEEDLLRSTPVSVLLDAEVPSFQVHTRVIDVLRRLPDTEAMSFCVTEEDGTVAGIVTMDELKTCMGDPSMADWLVVFDLMRPAPDLLPGDTTLADALQRMRGTGLTALPVVTTKNGDRYLGLVEQAGIERYAAREISRRQEAAQAS